ncbi:ANTAR domain-containing protein [Escherichia coli]
MLAARAHVSVAEAFTLMRSHARRGGLPLTAVAAAVIEGSLDDRTIVDS